MSRTILRISSRVRPEGSGLRGVGAASGRAGVVGRVVETGPGVARVLLLTDAESMVPVRRTRDGLPAIAAGRGDGLLEVRSVMTGIRLRPGDVAVVGRGGTRVGQIVLGPAERRLLRLPPA